MLKGKGRTEIDVRMTRILNAYLIAYLLALTRQWNRVGSPIADWYKDSRVGPYLNLPSEMTALRVDPRCFRYIALAEQEVNVFDWDLRVEHSSHDQHRRHRFSQQALFDE